MNKVAGIMLFVLGLGLAYEQGKESKQIENPPSEETNISGESMKLPDSDTTLYRGYNFNTGGWILHVKEGKQKVVKKHRYTAAEIQYLRYNDPNHIYCTKGTSYFIDKQQQDDRMDDYIHEHADEIKEELGDH